MSRTILYFLYPLEKWFAMYFELALSKINQQMKNNDKREQRGKGNNVIFF